ncbi:hypothetical protein [Streptomyces sp. NBRC 110611]|nr:hypothetical protein [Streptomyces sp. NBRC 110611]
MSVCLCVCVPDAIGRARYSRVLVDLNTTTAATSRTPEVSPKETEP